jgi:hypothetical protein
MCERRVLVETFEDGVPLKHFLAAAKLDAGATGGTCSWRDVSVTRVMRQTRKRKHNVQQLRRLVLMRIWYVRHSYLA